MRYYCDPVKGVSISRTLTRSSQSAFGRTLITLSKNMKCLDILHNLLGTVSNPKANPVHQKPDYNESIQQENGRPSADAHEAGRQEGTVGSRLRCPVHPGVRQTGEDESYGWRCDGTWAATQAVEGAIDNMASSASHMASGATYNGAASGFSLWCFELMIESHSSENIAIRNQRSAGKRSKIKVTMLWRWNTTGVMCDESLHRL